MVFYLSHTAIRRFVVGIQKVKQIFKLWFTAPWSSSTISFKNAEFIQMHILPNRTTFIHEFQSFYSWTCPDSPIYPTTVTASTCSPSHYCRFRCRFFSDLLSVHSLSAPFFHCLLAGSLLLHFIELAIHLDPAIFLPLFYTFGSIPKYKTPTPLVIYIVVELAEWSPRLG